MGRFRITDRKRWADSDTQRLSEMLEAGASLEEMQAAFPDRTPKAVRLHVVHIRKGKPSRAGEKYRPTKADLEADALFRTLQGWSRFTAANGPEQLVPVIVGSTTGGRHDEAA